MCIVLTRLTQQQESMDINSDNGLAERLRREDPEQFHTLVRMHLSFVLDLNTDDSLSMSHDNDVSIMSCPGNVLHVLSSVWKDAYGCIQLLRTSQNHQHASIIESECCECTSEKAKSRLQKWVFVPFAKKGKCVTKGVMEGAPLTQEGICQVYQLIEFLSKDQNICQEGVFRRSGKLTRQQELKSMLNQGLPLNLDEGNFSVHDCASVLKNFLAELPESLLTDAHYPAYCQIAEMCTNHPDSQNNDSRLLRALQLLFLLLPMENRVLLKDILQLLHLTASQEEKNKMSADSLATLFTPHLLCPRKLSPEAIHLNSQTMSGVISFMIQQGTELFNIPPKLATDIRVYLTERERRKLSPKKELNESICDGTAANTVFSFVDRERTALAHVSNPTEAALAQLYAHIQSLPESSKKKKLIKQFNKENGQGTPLQMNVRRKNHLRSKSLGDSIKKHIFQKGTKRLKDSMADGQFNLSRSLSQEMLNKPSTCLKLFQKSMEENTSSPIHPDEISETHKSPLKSTNCVLLQLRYTMLNNPNCELSSNLSLNTDSPQNESEIAVRDKVLQNLADQVTANHHENNTSESSSRSILGSRKRISGAESDSIREKESSPPKTSCCKTDPHPTSSTCIPTTPCQSDSTPSCRDQGTDVWPVSNPAIALPDLCCDCPVVDSPTALPGFSTPPVPVGNTNNRLTPRNALTCFLTTSTPASQCRLRVSSSTRATIDANHSNCLLTPIADENNSMSPITRSTQKMPKAMQETMMTPRCRKPVVLVSGSNLCHLANLSSWTPNQIRNSNGNYSIVEDKKNTRVKEVSSLGSCISSIGDVHTITTAKTYKEPEENEKENLDFKTTEIWSAFSNMQRSETSTDSSNSGSLTSTFRSYLLNRSVLTASPVDLSFSSRTGDFDTSESNNEDMILEKETLSSSLLYCLDGNQPSNSSATEEQVDDAYASSSCGSGGNASLQKCRVEVTKECDKSSQSYGTSVEEDENFCAVKYSTTALISNSSQLSKNTVHETSL